VWSTRRFCIATTPSLIGCVDAQAVIGEPTQRAQQPGIDWNGPIADTAGKFTFIGDHEIAKDRVSSRRDGRSVSNFSSHEVKHMCGDATPIRDRCV
jgi:hypothetical protein